MKKDLKVWVGIGQIIFAILGFVLNTQDSSLGFDFVTAAVALSGAFKIFKSYKESKQCLLGKKYDAYIIPD